MRRDPKLRVNKGWYALVFYDPARTPQRRYVALGTKRKDVAERRARELTARWERGEHDPWADAGRAAEVRALTVLQAHEAFVESVRARVERGSLSPATLADYANSLRSALAGLPAGLPLGALSAGHLERLVYRGELSPATQRGYYTKVAVFLKWCRAEALMQHEPLAAVERPAKYEPPPAWLRRDEMARVLAAIRADAARAATPGTLGYNGLSPLWVERAVRLAAATGLRLSELVRLRWQDVDRRSGFLYVAEVRGGDGRVRRTKGKRFRTVPIFPAAAAVLDELAAERRSEDDALPVVTNARGGACSAAQLSKRFRHYREAAGLDEQLHFHSLRHTFCSWLRLDGVDLDRIREWAGHKTIQQTLAYAHIIPEAVAREGARTFEYVG